MPRPSQNMSRHEGGHIDMTPMVDCVLVLVIFLIVSSVFVADPGIEVAKPDVGGTIGANRNFLLIAISADNRIFFDGQEIRLDQVGPLVKQASFTQDLPLIIRADRMATHGEFAAVYAEAKHAGIDHILFATARSEGP
jgi:biopolymer transport protein ExbD